MHGNTTSLGCGDQQALRFRQQFLGKVKTFKNLECLLTKQVCFHEQLKCSLKAGNNIIQSKHVFSSRLISKNLKTETYKAILLPI